MRQTKFEIGKIWLHFQRFSKICIIQPKYGTFDTSKVKRNSGIMATKYKSMKIS